ncbi:UPF0587 protein GA18326 isoform X2 [Cryptotermes secundus]|uniref:UPF0587 protein GA18326 isoform X2 n=1 Tax=Cryptotermes secundus TaxID=105785 RepID=UPI000CD7D717|nr:UPF0587 protein GA18326 isoform X2 [Cryptotermes secundus]
MMKCTACGESTNKWHDVSLSETVEDRTGHANMHYSAKCKLCVRENNLSILEDSIQVYTKSDHENFKTIVLFDCRGVELVDFDFRDGWSVVAEDSGQIYTDVDLSEKEWVEWDDKMKRSVGIYNIEHQFVHIK